MADLIDRQAVVDALIYELDGIDHVPQWVYDRLKKCINDLPSALVTCEHCKHSEYDALFHERWCRGREVEDDWYCGDGERGDADDT